jgi:branched-chain amino acid transport system substrate-binding protein
MRHAAHVHPFLRSCMAATALLALHAGAGAAADTPPPAKTVRVGFICPFSGGSQDFGNSARLGAELAVQEINEAGGYMGTRFELVERDDRSNPDEGRRIAEELVLQKKADFTIGYCNSGVAVKSLDVFQDNKHLLMIPVATGTVLTAKYAPASSYVFRVSVRDSVQARFIVDELVRRGLTRVAIFADTTGYGEGGLKDVERFLAEKSLAPVYVARFDLGVASLLPQMLEAKAAGANAIVSYTVGPENAAVARARAEARITAPQIGSWTLSFRSVAERAGPAADGALMAQTIIHDITHERRSSFVARYRRIAGNSAPIGSLMSAAQAYDAVHLMLRAMFQTRGDTSGPALKQALEDMQHRYAGVVTTYEKPFSPADHDAITANMLWLGVWRHDQVQFFYPEDARRAAAIPRKSLVAKASSDS